MSISPLFRWPNSVCHFSFSLIFRERLCELNIHRGNTVVQVTLAYEARK
ncbi:TPA: type I toxin-antitoxin system Hok family toxin [Escherichia coli]|nr:Hok/Gef family protein [Escherichia coli]EEZ6074983.1 Hok/Gef family protein [Escherichia coli O6]EFB9426332.1 Hok/Gef family protein [Escherichia coli]EFI0786318.1 Hok/Gef family protein [Escherichia coli]EFJ3663708.1 Hok/Gef family protein [Escherichia coli]